MDALWKLKQVFQRVRRRSLSKEGGLTWLVRRADFCVG